ncbi:MAG TPA: DUF421 domain-containing protein [Syntrophomonadaceae bacterium]|nr:DUF421 domain-containing protein [Syntrophomonadaceae bacterium]
MSPFYFEMILRAVLAFAALLVIARLLEKERTGHLSLYEYLVKTHTMPATREDLKIESQYQGLGSELIIDGEVIYQNLEQNKLDEAWLINEFNKQGIQTPMKSNWLFLILMDPSLWIKRKMSLFMIPASRMTPVIKNNSGSKCSSVPSKAALFLFWHSFGFEILFFRKDSARKSTIII